MSELVFSNSKDGFVQNVLTLKKFMNYEDYIFSFQSRIGNIFSLQNEEISNNEKFALGGRWLRGFDISGVGPRNSRTSYIGGNNLIVGKLDISKTLFSNTDNPIDFFVFGAAQSFRNVASAITATGRMMRTRRYKTRLDPFFICSTRCSDHS